MTNTLRKSHLKTVLEHLRSMGNITQGEALTVYNIKRVSARIRELRLRGHKIRSELKVDPAGSKYVRYYIESSGREDLDGFAI